MIGEEQERAFPESETHECVGGTGYMNELMNGTGREEGGREWCVWCNTVRR